MNLTHEIRHALKSSGVPLTLDQVMEQLPDGADRNITGARLRGMKKDGEVAASIEGGKVAYAWASDPVKANRSGTLTECIRALLREASEPMTVAQVCDALPEESVDTVGALLNQRKRAKEFDAVSAGGRTLAYSIAGQGGVSVAVSVGAPEPVAPPAAPPSPPPAAPKPATVSIASPPVVAGKAAAAPTLESLLTTALLYAEAARESYIESVVDKNIYSWLQQSVAAAQRTRNAWLAEHGS